MAFPVKPIFLTADSQLLFWKPEEGPSFLERARAEIEAAEPKAAYVGASNGDAPEFFELFRGAMETIGIHDCRLFPAEPTDEDRTFFDAADLVLLAGGDVRRGWRAFKENGLDHKLIERYYAGTVLVGLSAGAVQLGLWGFAEDDEGKIKVFETFKLVPALVDAHQEPGWDRLHRLLADADEPVRALGIPSGGGAVLHQDLTLEPVRRFLVELARDEEGEVRQSLLFPPGEEGGDEAGGTASGEDDVGAGVAVEQERVS